MAEAKKPIVELSTLTPEQAAERLGITLERAAELLAYEHDVLWFADVFVVDEETGVSMSEQADRKLRA